MASNNISSLNALTSLRFVFAFFVFLSHLTLVQFQEGKGLNFPVIFSEGFIGVSFFFILSGFILTHVYREQFSNSAETKSILSFLTKRFARIYPLYLLTMVLSIPLYVINIVDDPLIYAGIFGFDMAMLQSLIPIREVYFSFNSPGWSISTEFFFYLIFPFFLPLVLKVNVRSALLIIAFVLLAYFSLIAILPSNVHHSQFYISPIFRVLDFLLGIILYLLRSYILPFDRRDKLINIMQPLSILMLAIFIIFHSQVDYVYRYASYYWLPMSFVILCFSFDSGVLGRMLAGRVFVYFGEISFGFYLFHWLVIKYLNLVSYSNSLSVNVALIFSITCLLSIVSYELYEKRCRRMINEISAQKK